MIIRTVIALVLSVFAFFLTMRYNLHMCQLKGYKNDEHMYWLKKNIRQQWLLVFGLILGILRVIFPCLALDIINDLVLLLIILVYSAMKRLNTKKKLVYTARVKRLIATNLIVTAVILVLCAGFAGISPLAGMFMILVSIQLVVLILINVINHPVEMGVNQYYINDAKKKLKEVPNLTIIGVTGSYGKTSVKFYLQKLLQERYNVLVTPEC